MKEAQREAAKQLETYQVYEKAYNFAIGDEINTLKNPDASVGSKAVALASIIPAEKIPQLGAKLTIKFGKQSIAIGSDVIKALKGMKYLDNVLGVMKTNKAKYFNNRAYDCSEIAEDLLKAANGKGKIYEIIGKDGKQMKGYEYGEIMKYDYHQIFSDGKYIYDPRYSDRPIANEEYFKIMNTLNNGNIKINTLD
jgi:hypothetical protein